MLLLVTRFYFRLIRHDSKRSISVFELRKTYHHNKPHEIEMKVNTIVPIFTRSKRLSLVTNLCKKRNFLKLSDIYKLELAKFTHKLWHNKLPNVLKTEYIKIVYIHCRETRSPNRLDYFLLRVNKTACHYKLDYREVKLWNEIKDELKKIFLLVRKIFDKKIMQQINF